MEMAQSIIDLEIFFRGREVLGTESGQERKQVIVYGHRMVLLNGLEVFWIMSFFTISSLFSIE